MTAWLTLLIYFAGVVGAAVFGWVLRGLIDAGREEAEATKAKG